MSFNLYYKWFMRQNNMSTRQKTYCKLGFGCQIGKTPFTCVPLRTAKTRAFATNT